jgi:hypothetical protein
MTITKYAAKTRSLEVSFCFFYIACWQTYGLTLWTGTCVTFRLCLGVLSQQKAYFSFNQKEVSKIFLKIGQPMKANPLSFPNQSQSQKRVAGVTLRIELRGRTQKIWNSYTKVKRTQGISRRPESESEGESESRYCVWNISLCTLVRVDGFSMIFRVYQRLWQVSQSPYK